MKKQKLLTKIFLASMLLAVPVCAGFGVAATTSHADTAITGSYSEQITVTNGSFNSSNSSYSRNDVTGWTRIKGDGRATTMIIDTGSSFTKSRNTPYYLSCDNPGSSNPSDKKILMVNSALKSGQTDGYTREGYKSNDITLSANSYYSFQVAVKTKSFNEASEFASMYLTGLKDADGKEVKMAFERKSEGEWTNFYFFVATGDESQTVSLHLWLGTEDINSYGVAFFDDVCLKRYSANAFYEVLEGNHAGYNSVNSTAKYVKIETARRLIDTTGYNFDFEEDKTTDPSNLPGWKVVNSETTSTKAHAEPLSMESKEYFESKTGKSYPGTNYKNNNKQSMVLWTEEATSIAIESKELPIKLHECYKITASVKTNLESGAFRLRVKETDSIFTAFPGIKSSYTLHTGESTEITSTSSDEYNNNYQEVSFYVQGHNLYNSAIKLELALGSSETGALGYAIVDDITVEKVASSDLPSQNVLSLLPTKSSDTISNGMFNFVSTTDDNLSYPLLPANWTVSQDENEYTSAGIINTYSAYYAEYSTENWGSLPNPAKITGSPVDDTKSNNVFMFWNGLSAYQSIKNTDTFSISANSYYDLSFQYKTYTGGLTVELINDDGVVLFSDENITAQASWNTYHAYIYTGEAAHSVRLVVHFGTEKDPQAGYAFLDNVKIDSSTEAVYSATPRHIDMSNLLLNLDTYGKVNSNITEHPAFSGSITNGTDAEGGVIIGNGNTSFTDQNNNPINKNQDLPNNVLVLRVGEGASYNLSSKYKLNVEKDKYYTLKFKALTNYFPILEDLPKKDKDGKAIEYNYGLSVGLSTFDKVSKLTCNDGWTEYTIVFKSTKSESATLDFSLISNNANIYGTAFITDIAWAESDEATYTSAENKSDYNKTLFTTTTSEEVNNDDNTSDDDNTDSSDTSSSDNYTWILIPSIITAVAVIIAVVGTLLRKIKLGKKIKEAKDKKIASTEYDRKDKLDQTYVKNQAKKLREEEVDKVEKDIETLTKDLETLEAEHKEYIENARKENGGKVTKEIERQFKLYSSKRSKLTDKLQKANENLETIKSPDYLLVLEKKVANQNKDVEKKSKKDLKDNPKK
jgi:hypothetical protein